MYTTYDGTYIDYGEDDEKEDYGSFEEPDQCDTCKAWVYDANDHAPNCPHFEERDYPFEPPFNPRTNGNPQSTRNR